MDFSEGPRGLSRKQLRVVDQEQQGVLPEAIDEQFQTGWQRPPRRLVGDPEQEAFPIEGRHGDGAGGDAAREALRESPQQERLPASERAAEYGIAAGVDGRFQQRVEHPLRGGPRHIPAGVCAVRKGVPQFCHRPAFSPRIDTPPVRIRVQCTRDGAEKPPPPSPNTEDDLSSSTPLRGEPRRRRETAIRWNCGGWALPRRAQARASPKARPLGGGRRGWPNTARRARRSGARR